MQLPPVNVKKSLVVIIIVAALAHTTRASAQDETASEMMTITRAVTIAKERAADIRYARAQAESYDAAADAALAGYLPTLSARVTATDAVSRTTVLAPNGTRVTFPGSSKTGEAAGTVRWTAFDFGRTPSTVGAARADARSAAARADATVNEVVRLVATAFLNAVFDEALLESSRTTLKLRERHAALSKALVTSGIRPPVEEARARVEMELARLEVTSTEVQLAQDKVHLATALMLEPTTALRLVKPAVLPTVTESAKTAANMAENRPDVHATRENVSGREETLDAARAARWPSVTAQVEALGDMTQTPDGRFLPTKSVTGFVGVSIPLFDWAVWGRIPVERANVAAAKAQADSTLAQLRGQAAENALRLRGARLLAEQSREARELAAATLAVMEGRYQAGLVTVTDLFDAGTKDADARSAAIRSELGLALATVEVLASTNRIGELGTK